MHPGIRMVDENERGCGRRKDGGLYLVADGAARGCGKLPLSLEVCPCCGHGIRPSRAPRWLKHPERLWRGMGCRGGDECLVCPMSNGYETGPALLVWVGEKYYPTPRDFSNESRVMGISRRITAIPKDFVVGETWVLLAHRKAIEVGGVFSPDAMFQPGIFAMFKPTRVEIVVSGTEPDWVIDDYIDRGLTPVLINRKAEAAVQEEQLGLFGDNENA